MKSLLEKTTSHHTCLSPELKKLLAVLREKRVKGSKDGFVSNDVLELVAPDARLLYVGKTAGYHSRTQEEIHELLLSFVEAGATVVRLKGGDPLVFAELKDFATVIQSPGLVSPTLIIIGKVVELPPLWPHCSIESSCLVETCYMFRS